jgi:predicted kinase
MRGLVHQLAEAFAASPDIFDAADAKRFSECATGHLERLAPVLDQRSARGLVRRCHGDLHTGNIVIVNTRPLLFDAIEFSEKIATIDVLYDLAFLLMDLVHRNARSGANRLFNHYLNLRRAEEDLTGLAALPFFLGIRAGVRALVTADRIHSAERDSAAGAREEARRFLANCLTELNPPPPQLICIGGLSGSGKSTLAMALAPSVGAVPGALVVRSDVERKVLAGVAETAALPPETYTPENSARVYDAAFARAASALRAGQAVVLDAVFSKPEERERAEALARTWGAAFRGFWLDANPAHLKARVAARSADASDANMSVVEKQLGYQTGEIAWHRLDANRPVVETLTAALQQVRANVVCSAST